MRSLLLLAPILLAAAPVSRPSVNAPPVPQVAAAPPAQAGLQLAMPAFAPREALRRVLLKPYAAASATGLSDTGWDGVSLETLKAKPADLALLDAAQVNSGCKSGVLARLDWARLNRDRFLPQTSADCGAGAYISATALAWDRDKLPGAPGWSDFWDVARHPGRRALAHTARGTLEIALLADGVAPGDVYRALRTPEGQDRAFRKLDQLKPYLVWWDQPSQPAQWLASGKVLLTSAPADVVLQATEATHRHLGVQWNGSLSSIFFWAVPQAAPHPAAATLALLIATDPARLAEFNQTTSLGPSTQDALAVLAPRSDNLVGNLGAGLIVDAEFWLENDGKLEPRFAAWLTK